MPLKRTPPSSSSEQQPKPTKTHRQKQKLLQQHVDSADSAPNTSDDEDSTRFTTEKLKRKLQVEDAAGDFQSFVSEMRILFANLSSNNEKKLECLKKSVDSIKSDMNEMAKSLDFLSSKYDELLKNYNTLLKEKQEDSKYIHQLEDQIENLQRKSRNTSIELRNITQRTHENKQHLCDIVRKVGEITKNKIEANCIKDIYRVHTRKEGIKPIIVEFTSTLQKESVLSSIKHYNKGKKRDDKLHSKHIDMEGPPKPIYASECLTQKTKHLFYLARDFAKTNSYMFCWTSNGIVYLRKQDNTPHIRVNTEMDLKKLLTTPQ